MTDQLHTPSDDRPGTLHKDFVRDLFDMGAVYFKYVETLDEAEPHFNRWYEAEIAAAEQRGAERGWDQAIDYVWDDSAIYQADAARAKSKNPYRTDQEGAQP